MSTDVIVWHIPQAEEGVIILYLASNDYQITWNRQVTIW